MENVLKSIYWSVAAIIFVMALSIWMKMDKIMEKRYKEVLYNERYVEISNSKID